MRITKRIVADQIAGYLRGEITLDKLVDWAEHQMMEGQVGRGTVRDAVAKLGLADVRAFGLTWEDCRKLLRKLGFEVQVEVAVAK
jgi:cobyrinic acid a,c-diamide synthase